MGLELYSRQTGPQSSANQLAEAYGSGLRGRWKEEMTRGLNVLTE